MLLCSQYFHVRGIGLTNADDFGGHDVIGTPLLKRAETKGSIQTRRMRAGWDDDYLLQILQGIPSIVVR